MSKVRGIILKRIAGVYSAVAYFTDSAGRVYPVRLGYKNRGNR